MVDVPLLRKAVEWVEEQQARQQRMRLTMTLNQMLQEIGREDGVVWYQGTWMTQLEHQCGTACCLAGYVALETGWHEGHRMSTVRNHAQRKLGISDGQASALFNGTNDAARIRSVAEWIAHQEL